MLSVPNPAASAVRKGSALARTLVEKSIPARQMVHLAEFADALTFHLPSKMEEMGIAPPVQMLGTIAKTHLARKGLPTATTESISIPAIPQSQIARALVETGGMAGISPTYDDGTPVDGGPVTQPHTFSASSTQINDTLGELVRQGVIYEQTLGSLKAAYPQLVKAAVQLKQSPAGQAVAQGAEQQATRVGRALMNMTGAKFNAGKVAMETAAGGLTGLYDTAVSDLINADGSYDPIKAFGNVAGKSLMFGAATGAAAMGIEAASMVKRQMIKSALSDPQFVDQARKRLAFKRVEKAAGKAYMFRPEDPSAIQLNSGVDPQQIVDNVKKYLASGQRIQGRLPDDLSPEQIDGMKKALLSLPRRERIEIARVFAGDKNSILKLGLGEEVKGLTAPGIGERPKITTQVRPSAAVSDKELKETILGAQPALTPEERMALIDELGGPAKKTRRGLVTEAAEKAAEGTSAPEGVYKLTYMNKATKREIGTFGPNDKIPQDIVRGVQSGKIVVSRREQVASMLPEKLPTSKATVLPDDVPAPRITSRTLSELSDSELLHYANEQRAIEAAKALDTPSVTAGDPFAVHWKKTAQRQVEAERINSIRRQRSSNLPSGIHLYDVAEAGRRTGDKNATVRGLVGLSDKEYKAYITNPKILRALRDVLDESARRRQVLRKSPAGRVPQGWTGTIKDLRSSNEGVLQKLGITPDEARVLVNDYISDDVLAPQKLEGGLATSDVFTLHPDALAAHLQSEDSVAALAQLRQAKAELAAKGRHVSDDAALSYIREQKQEMQAGSLPVGASDDPSGIDAVVSIRERSRRGGQVGRTLYAQEEDVASQLVQENAETVGFNGMETATDPLSTGPVNVAGRDVTIDAGEQYVVQYTDESGKIARAEVSGKELLEGIEAGRIRPQMIEETNIDNPVDKLMKKELFNGEDGFALAVPDWVPDPERMKRLRGAIKNLGKSYGIDMTKALEMTDEKLQEFIMHTSLPLRVMQRFPETRLAVDAAMKMFGKRDAIRYEVEGFLEGNAAAIRLKAANPEIAKDLSKLIRSFDIAKTVTPEKESAELAALIQRAGPLGDTVNKVYQQVKSVRSYLQNLAREWVHAHTDYARLPLEQQKYIDEWLQRAIFANPNWTPIRRSGPYRAWIKVNDKVVKMVASKDKAEIDNVFAQLQKERDEISKRSLLETVELVYEDFTQGPAGIRTRHLPTGKTVTENIRGTGSSDSSVDNILDDLASDIQPTRFTRLWDRLLNASVGRTSQLKEKLTEAFLASRQEAYRSGVRDAKKAILEYPTDIADMSRHFQERFYVPGYNDDLVDDIFGGFRSFAANIQEGLPRATLRNERQGILEAIRAVAYTYRPGVRNALVGTGLPKRNQKIDDGWVGKYLDTMIDYESDPQLLQAIRAGLYSLQLNFNGAFIVQNGLMQSFATTLPEAMKYGEFGRGHFLAGAQLAARWKALYEHDPGKFAALLKEAKLPREQVEVLGRLHKEGALGSNVMADVVNELDRVDIPAAGRRANTGLRNILLGLVAGTERGNRVHAAITFSGIGRELGYTGDELYNFVNQHIVKTQFGVSDMWQPLAVSSSNAVARDIYKTATLYLNYKWNYYNWLAGSIGDMLTPTSKIVGKSTKGLSGQQKALLRSVEGKSRKGVGSILTSGMLIGGLDLTIMNLLTGGSLAAAGGNLAGGLLSELGLKKMTGVPDLAKLRDKVKQAADVDAAVPAIMSYGDMVDANLRKYAGLEADTKGYDLLHYGPTGLLGATVTPISNPSLINEHGAIGSNYLDNYIKSWARAVKDLQRGDWRGVVNTASAASRNLQEASDALTTGQLSYPSPTEIGGRRNVAPANALDIFYLAMGLTPTKLENARRVDKSVDKFVEARETGLNAVIETARNHIRNNKLTYEDDTVLRLREEILAFNDAVMQRDRNKHYTIDLKRFNDNINEAFDWIQYNGGKYMTLPEAIQFRKLHGRSITDRQAIAHFIRTNEEV